MKKLDDKLAEDLATEYGLTQVLIITYDGGVNHVLAYGSTPIDKEQVAVGKDSVEKLLSVPQELNIVPPKTSSKKSRKKSGA